MAKLQTRKQKSHKLGLFAESLAAAYLRLKGYRILAQRHRTIAGEIDLLAYKKDTLVIVEVKARDKQEDGLYSVTPAKQRRLNEAALAVLAELHIFRGLENSASLNIRFDAIIIAPGRLPLHVQNAWST